MPEADVIISAAPLTESTTNPYEKDLFEGLKPSAIFINVGRGKSVVTDDLFDALQANKFAAAGLDYTEPEPLPSDHPLWTLPNVVITPHVSSGGNERERRTGTIARRAKTLCCGRYAVKCGWPLKRVLDKKGSWQTRLLRFICHKE